jgi:amidase
MTPLGLGNDLGGSLRNPAHCCGIAAFKPSSGVLPWASALEPNDPPLSIQLMAVEGPMARCVADLRVALDVLAGPHPRDPRALPVHLAEPDVTRRLRVAVVTNPPGGSTHLDIAGAVHATADRLADAGAHVVEIVPASYVRSIELWRELVLADLRLVAPLVAPLMGVNGRDFLQHALECTAPPDFAAYAALHIARAAIERDWLDFFADVDILLTPTWTEPAFPEGSDSISAERAVEVLELMRPVFPASALGLPAAVVPVGRAAGLPVGVQVIGRRFSDRAVLAAAASVEALSGAMSPIEPSTPASVQFT